jgi:PAS domain S-box-containing protein
MPQRTESSSLDALRAAERRLRALEEKAAGHGIVTIDAEGRIAGWSAGARAILGWSEEEVLGRGVAMLFTPEDRADGLPERELERMRAQDAAQERKAPQPLLLMRGDGSRCRADGETIALRDEAGAFEGYLKLLYGRPDGAGQQHLSSPAADVAEQGRPEDLRLVADALPVLIGYVDSGQCYRFNNRFYEDWFGRPRGEITGRHVREVVGEEAYAIRREAIEAALAGEHVVFDAFMPHRDGSRRETEMQYVPRRNADGSVDGFFVIVFDVTARKRSEEHLRLLNDELNHRVKNLLATVQSVAWQTLGDAVSLAHARQDFTSRLMVLAKAHDLMTMRNWDGATIAELVSLTVEAHQGTKRRFLAAGPDIRLPTKAALSVSMALHELATNAIKYGALSNETGQVSIDWRILDGIEGRCLTLRWRESGGPPVEPPARKGFGSRLIERGLAAELSGVAQMDYDRSGLVCTVEAPLGPG